MAMDVQKVAQLSAKIHSIDNAIAILDNGGKITNMTIALDLSSGNIPVLPPGLTVNASLVDTTDMTSAEDLGIKAIMQQYRNDLQTELDNEVAS